MRVSTQVQVDSKEVINAVIEAAKAHAKVQEPGSATVVFTLDGTAVASQDLTAEVEFVKAGHS